MAQCGRRGCAGTAKRAISTPTPQGDDVMSCLCDKCWREFKAKWQAFMVEYETWMETPPPPQEKEVKP